MNFEEIEAFYKKAKTVKDDIPQIEIKVAEFISLQTGHFEELGEEHQETRNKIINRVAAVLREEFGVLEDSVAETLERVRLGEKLEVPEKKGAKKKK